MLKWLYNKLKNLISNVFKKNGRKKISLPELLTKGKFINIPNNSPKVKFTDKGKEVLDKGEKVVKLLNTFNDYVYKLGRQNPR